MKKQFLLFQSPIDLAHNYWEQLVTPDNIVVDATCGNGHDTLALAGLHPRVLYAFDIQPEAIASTQAMLEDNLHHEQLENVHLIQQSHENFPAEVNGVKLFVYNLGYLPGGDKSKTTRTKTTLQSIKNAQEILIPGGVICITCYPGHPEGKLEEESILEHTNSLSPKKWSCCHHRWTNRNASPSLLIIQKSL